MKKNRIELFEVIKSQYLNKNIEIYLYFINNNEYLKGKILVEERPFIVVNTEIEHIFSNIDKQEILSNLNPQYRFGWENTVEKVENAIRGNRLVQLNWATTVIFGPHFNPYRSAQSYNVYSTLYFKISEIDELIDYNKLDTAKGVSIENEIFYNIDAILEAFKNDIIENTTNNKEETNGEEIDEFAKLKSISLSNFFNLDKVDIEFSAGINVIIGENNVGKTGFMKFLYANAKAYEEYGKARGTSNERSFKERLSIKLQKTFQSDEQIGAIVNKNSDEALKSDLAFIVNGSEDEKNIALTIEKTTKTDISEINFKEIYHKDALYKYNVVFIPAKEILSITNAIKIALNYSTSGFDATYEDLLKDIEPLFAKKSEKNILNKIAEEFEKDIIEGEVEYNSTKGKYYFKSKNGSTFDMTMTAEGIKQTGIIPLLIRTGKITEGTILFLDEPDNNLNPVAIKKLTSVLLELASVGVQIFVTTHSYLFSQYLSLYNEFKKTLDKSDFPDSRFLSFYRDENNKTSIEQGGDLLDIEHNLILDEHVRLTDKEQELIQNSENL